MGLLMRNLPSDDGCSGPYAAKTIDQATSRNALASSDRSHSGTRVALMISSPSGTQKDYFAALLSQVFVESTIKGRSLQVAKFFPSRYVLRIARMGGGFRDQFRPPFRVFIKACRDIPNSARKTCTGWIKYRLAQVCCFLRDCSSGDLQAWGPAHSVKVWPGRSGHRRFTATRAYSRCSGGKLSLRSDAGVGRGSHASF